MVFFVLYISIYALILLLLWKIGAWKIHFLYKNVTEFDIVATQ